MCDCVCDRLCGACVCVCVCDCWCECVCVCMCACVCVCVCPIGIGCCNDGDCAITKLVSLCVQGLRVSMIPTTPISHAWLDVNNSHHTYILHTWLGINNAHHACILHLSRVHITLALTSSPSANLPFWKSSLSRNLRRICA